MPRRKIRLRVVTWNAHIAKKRPPWQRRLARAKAAIAHIATRCDIAVLQEYGQHPELLNLPDHDTWDPTGSRPPHLWRDTHLDPIARGTRLLARGRRVGKIPGFRSALDDYKASIVRYRLTLPNGQTITVTVVGVHLPAHIEHPRGEVAHTERGDMWTECVIEIARTCEDELTGDLANDEPPADVVVVVGDWNMRLSAGLPFHPITGLAHDGYNVKRIRPGEPTHRFREIDGGFVVYRTPPTTPAPAAAGEVCVVDVDVHHTHVMRGPNLPHLPGRWFDHRPVHATLEITTKETP